ncbi:hypothetical protein H2198_001215 [Neophaeococcomyces mojaviensis]|uniref:Uncharacterized protein n=1 Tax=Neophaeococcomyces mojaviensis TaxID=3383035 RepID=A0ACC3AHP7_9EURO|nr:hypothetical protein H2198_001215 [Knufia sp. JES_112]
MANDGPSALPVSSNSLPDNVTIRVITLAHGDRTENDLYLVLSPDTTVGALKERIHDGLSQHPALDTQRLLYYGRPLLDNQATLRHILRQEQRPGNASASHVLHLVIRDRETTDAPAAAQPHVHGRHAPRADAPFPAVQLQTPGIPPAMLPTMPPAMPPTLPDFAHNMIHNSMHMMQHQMQHQRAVEEATRRARGIHNHMHHGNTEPAQQAQPQPQPQAPPTVQMNQNPTTLGLPGQDQAGQPVPRLPSPSVQTTRIQETIGPNGERIRTVVNNHSMMFQITGNNLPNPFDRPSSAPGASPSANSDPANRAGGPAAPSIQIHAHPPQIPPGLLFPPGRQLPLPIPTAPQMIMPPLAHMNPSIPPQGPTMAWLLSSPQGPQGIVFAPGHGFFSTAASITTLPSQIQTQPQPTPTVPANNTQSQIPGRHSTARTETPEVRNGNHPPPPQPGARPQPNVPIAAQPAAQPLAQAQRPAQQANEDNDMLQFLINRGWLFLRLYLFVFVLSESGTWRRIFMLGSAIIFCLLPRQNPLTDMFNVMRRHFDNLIGPPQIPQRQPQGEQQQDQAPQNNAQTGGTVNAAGTTQGQGQASNQTRPTPTRTMPTPEETARRLLAQHQDRRNANPVFDTLYRIEQGIALFLASLIPGVGERHVRAREEARRIVEEDDRRRQQEAEQQGHNQNGSAGNKSSDAVAGASNSTATVASAPGSGSEGASSSGVDRTGNAGGQQDVRPRGAGSGTS